MLIDFIGNDIVVLNNIRRAMTKPCNGELLGVLDVLPPELLQDIFRRMEREDVRIVSKAARDMFDASCVALKIGFFLTPPPTHPVPPGLILGCPNLKSLELGGEVKDKHLLLRAAAARCTTIDRLTMLDWSKNTWALMAPELAQLTTLQTLDLMVEESDNAAPFADALEHLTDLQDLTLECVFSDAALVALAVGKLQKLRRLQITNSDLGSDGANALATNLPNSLRHLSLLTSGIDDQGAVALSQAFVRLGNLETLEIDNRDCNWNLGNIGPEGSAAIASTLPCLTALRALQLSDFIDSDGERVLASPLKFLNGLTRLSLEASYPAGCPSTLYEALKGMPHLTELDIVNIFHVNGLADAFASLPRLQRLALSSGDDDDVTWPRAVAHLKGLEELAVHGLSLHRMTRMGSSCAEILVPSLKALTSLTKLEFENIRADETAEAMIKAVVPFAVFDEHPSLKIVVV